MRAAISCPDVGDPAAIVALAVEAEARGWDGFFVWDHVRLHPGFEVHDAWVLLGAIARATERLVVGTLVTPVPRRRAWGVAKQLVTLDHLSGGRAVLGVGIGAPDDVEFADLGEETDRRRRAAALDEGLGVIDRVCRGEPVWDGGPTLPPGSAQRPRPPVWVAGMAPHSRPRDRAARWDGFVPLRSGGEPLTPEEVAAYAGDLLGRPGFDVVATRAEAVPARAYGEVGCTWVVDSCWPEGDWLADLRRRVEAGPEAT